MSDNDELEPSNAKLMQRIAELMTAFGDPRHADPALAVLIAKAEQRDIQGDEAVATYLVIQGNLVGGSVISPRRWLTNTAKSLAFDIKGSGFDGPFVYYAAETTSGRALLRIRFDRIDGFGLVHTS